MRKSERGVTVYELVVTILLLMMIVLAAGIIYVAIHFIGKYW